MQAGKLFPRLTFADFGQAVNVPNRCPPRRVIFRCENVNLQGDLALAWAGVSVMSDVGVRNSLKQLEWRMPHPTLSGYEMVLTWSIVANPSAGNTQDLLFHLKYFAEGSMQGDITMRKSVNDFNEWSNGYDDGRPYFWNSAINWGNKLHPTRLQLMAIYQVLGANWADQPDFQPYRTRP